MVSLFNDSICVNFSITYVLLINEILELTQFSLGHLQVFGNFYQLLALLS